MLKVISRLLWFCFSLLCDWPAKHVPPCQPMRSKTKIMTCLHAFSRAWRQLHVFAFDWFIALFASAVIGQNNYFGFGFTTLK